MGIIFFLILFPLAVAILLLLLNQDAARGAVVVAGAIVTAAASIYLTVKFFSGGAFFEVQKSVAEIISYGMTAIEVILAVVVFVLGVKHRKYLACLLVLIQTPIMLWFEFSTGEHIEATGHLYVDRLSLIMALIIGIIGTLICVYALGYMKDFRHHHANEPDRRPWFFFLLFLFLAAMYGIIFSNHLVWMFFFWEITTLCSFFLIGFTKTKEATNNAFRAITMNLLGGLAFVLAIVWLGRTYETIELSRLIDIGVTSGAGLVAVPVVLLAFAGITKAAQMPFNSWLLGAMVAPTPTSALLHSSTMVKAGVFLILKLAPCLGLSHLGGFLTMFVGGITFVAASCAAVSQSNAKRVLAYSTVANLGLIVACAGVGSPAAVWAATMLIIFHAVTKSLLFLCVGTAEHNIGSRDIEDMDGLFGRMPKLALFMIIGISAMFLAPFGMLVSKWAAFEAVVVSGNPFLPIFVIFGSSVTLFYWGKWLGKLTAVIARRENIQDRVHGEEWTVLTSLTVLVLIACITFPIYSKFMVVPYIEDAMGYLRMYGMDVTSGLLGDVNMFAMSFFTMLIVLIPILFYGGGKSKKIAPIYLAGAGRDDDLTYVGSMQKETPFALRNWYMESYFGEKKMNVIGISATCVTLAITFSVMIGGLLK